MDFITLLVALNSGVQLAKTLGTHVVEVNVQVHEHLVGDVDLPGSPSAILTRMEVTNLSGAPQTVTDVWLRIGEARARWAPLRVLKAEDMAKTMLVAISDTFDAFFERPDRFGFMDWSLLPHDLYLLENQAKTGCALFIAESAVEAGRAFVGVRLSGGVSIERELKG